MAGLTAEQIEALIANIDASIARIVAKDATDHTIGGQGGHSVRLSASLKALKETREMYEKKLEAVQSAAPAFLRTSVDLSDA